MHKFSIQDSFFFLILIGLSAAFFKIISPFLLDIFMAMILITLFRKPYRYLSTKIGRGKGAFVTVLMSIFIVAIPLIVVGIMVSAEAAGNYTLFKEKWPEIQNYITSGALLEKVKAIPLVGEHIDLESIDFSQFQSKISEFVTTAAGFVFTLVQKAFVNITSLIIHSFFVLILMFYMLLDGEKLMGMIYRYSPLSDSDEKEFTSELVKITDAIIFNTFLVGVIEGCFGGVLFAFLGISSPFFWGVLMVILSMLPLVGANTIIIPVVIFEYIIGNYVTATILLILGTGGVLINQNILKPRLDGNKSGLHPAIVFVSSIGAIAWIGIPGFLVGPLTAALFIVIWNQYYKRYRGDLERWNSGG